jgi:hypothetical protein
MLSFPLIRSYSMTVFAAVTVLPLVTRLSESQRGHHSSVMPVVA